MIANTKDLETVIDGVLKPRGFLKRRSAWYRHHAEVISVLDLQKSRFGGQYYVNLAVALHGLNPGEYPPEERCHIRVRLEEIANREDVLQTFDLENRSLKSAERTQQICMLIETGADWLEKLTTVESVADQIRSDESLQNRSTLQLRRFLNLESAP